MAALLALGAITLSCLNHPRNDCRDFDLEKVPTDGIEKSMTIGTTANVPAALSDFQGLWWMNGNERSYEVVSFGAVFPAVDEDNKSLANTWEMKMYEEKVMSFDATIKGSVLYRSIRNFGLSFRIQKFNESAYQLKPVFNVPAMMVADQVPIDSWAADFWLIKTVDKDVWFSTGSYLSSDTKQCKFTRIVDGNGARTVKYSTDFAPGIGNPNDSEEIGLKKEQFIAIAEKSNKF